MLEDLLRSYNRAQARAIRNYGGANGERAAGDTERAAAAPAAASTQNPPAGTDQQPPASRDPSSRPPGTPTSASSPASTSAAEAPRTAGAGPSAVPGRPVIHRARPRKDGPIDASSVRIELAAAGVSRLGFPGRLTMSRNMASVAAGERPRIETCPGSASGSFPCHGGSSATTTTSSGRRSSSSSN